jgi:murein DD-endopeptidase MepM/ murein hydrolase activator NlpD
MMSPRKGKRFPQAIGMIAFLLPLSVAAWMGQEAFAKPALAQEPATAKPAIYEPVTAPIIITCRSLRPGEVLAVRLREGAGVKRVTLTLGDQVRVLEPAVADSPAPPAALLGLDLNAKPKPMVLRVRIEPMAGPASMAEISLPLEARAFPSTRLEVAPGMANPPAKEMETIRREAEIVSAVLDTISPEWLAAGPFQSPLPDFEPFPNFGQQRTYNKTVASVHSGVDISAPRGTLAEAPNAGRIVLAARLYFSGNTVIIDHGRGVFTYCCHFDELLVKRGDLVRKGQAIAKVGSTGRSTGPHLHWSVRVLSARVDPFSLVGLPFD